MFLIVGGDSEIGGAAYYALKAQGKPVVATTRRRERVTSDRPFLDLAGSIDCWEPPQDTRAACVCAAVARLATCATDPERAARINVAQTLTLIDRLLERGIYVLFLSTNQVFDGRVPHITADAPYSPVSEYGRQKARTESLLRERLSAGAPAAILRLSKVVSPAMPLIRDWIEALKAGKPIRAFYDMTLAPVPIDLVCMAILALMDDRACGVFQLTGPSDVSYVDMARFLAVRLGVDLELVCAMSARNAGLPEGIGPENTTLCSDALKERYAIVPPEPWTVIEELARYAEMRDERQTIC
jgi:dTDP-4-dehydrorhamnose reductase